MRAEPQDAEAYSFRRRALAEAARYGSDPYVFVRELLQNARDAGASRVEIEVSRQGARDRFSCRDDGCGMTYEHARRYLFALYASSKEDSAAEAGKFGIGFWSVLRLAPTTITVRSRAANHDAWEVTIDGGLERVAATQRVTAATTTLQGGTEVVLEWPARPGEDPAEVIFDATRRYGRFLSRRDDAEAPLAITVDGRGANAELTLPQPSSSFRGKGFRGAVGLGSAPEVELFAQGLFVRSAASLQDLRGAGELHEAASAEDALAELPALAPRILIDSAELDLMLARGDARYDKHLRRLLRAAEKALGRLITRQLQALRPQPWYRLALGALRDRIEPHLSFVPLRGNGGLLAAAGLAGLLLGLALWWWLPLGRLPLAAGVGPTPPDATREAAAGTAEAGPTPAAPAASGVEPSDWPPPEVPGLGSRTTADAPSPNGRRRSELHRYFDLATSYRGPSTGVLADDPSRLAMLYEPAAAVPFFAALLIEDPSAGQWEASPAAGPLPPYPPTPCRTGCLTVRLLVAPRPGRLRLPVPTGHRLDPSSVRLDGEPLEVWETAMGEAVVRHRPTPRGLLEYRTGPAPAPPDRRGPASRGPAPGRRTKPPSALPAELDAVATKLRRRPLHERVQQGLDYVARRVVYDRSGGGAGGPMPAGGDFVAAALAAGAGDCDVQNGVLAALLRAAGVEARLAVGYVGLQGTVASGLHAWVEYGDDLGNLHVADASVTSGGEDLVAASGLAEPRYEMPAGGLMTPRPLAAGVADGPSAPATMAVLVILLAAAGSAALWLRRRLAGPAPAGAGEELAALLGGALRHPEAFAGMPAMFHGRFVPLVGRSTAISLAQARRLAAKSRLFRSRAGSPLARRAAARGVPVIDAATAEGRVLSLALGAIDVDHWSDALTHSEESDLCQRINRRLKTAAAPWRLRQAAGTAPSPRRAPEPWTEIALEDLDLGRRLIVLELGAPEFVAARGLLPKRPEAAAFTIVDVLIHRLALTGRERARILAAFARPAVEEAA